MKRFYLLLTIFTIATFDLMAFPYGMEKLCPDSIQTPTPELLTSLKNTTRTAFASEGAKANFLTVHNNTNVTIQFGKFTIPAGSTQYFTYAHSRYMEDKIWVKISSSLPIACGQFLYSQNKPLSEMDFIGSKVIKFENATDWLNAFLEYEEKTKDRVDMFGYPIVESAEGKQKRSKWAHEFVDNSEQIILTYDADEDTLQEFLKNQQ